MGQLDQSPSVEAWSGFGPWFIDGPLVHFEWSIDTNRTVRFGPDKPSGMLEFGPFFVMLNKNDCYK